MLQLFYSMGVYIVLLLHTQLSLTLPWDLDAMAPAKRPAGRLNSKPAASISTIKSMRAGAGRVHDKSKGTGTAAQLRAMKQTMKALRDKGSNSSAKLSKAPKSSKANHKVRLPEPGQSLRSSTILVAKKKVTKRMMTFRLTTS